jgi:hypothetical protein
VVRRSAQYVGPVVATAEQLRGGERRDVARFLAAHEHCDADYEIRRPTDPTDGRLRLVCNGCGARAAYDVGDPGVLKLIEGGGEGGASAAKPARRRRPKRPTQAQMQRWLPSPAALPWWVPNAYILAVIVIGLAMIGFGVLRPGADERAVLGGSGDEVASEPAPAPAPGPVAPPPVNQAGSQPEPEPSQPKARPERPPELRRITVLGRFRIGLPPGWRAGEAGGAAVFAAPGGDAEIRVYLEPGDRGPRQLARAAAGFLRDQNPGAKLSRPRALRLAGDPAVAIEARHRGGEDRAVLLSESGYEYLVWSRVEAEAPSRTEATAVAAVQSFSAL